MDADTRPWVGVDFDGTLRRLSDGEPVPSMVERIHRFRLKGVPVRILTARIASKYGTEHIAYMTDQIQAWCLRHIGEALPVTSEKDYDMVVLYDDRAIAVQTDTGECKGWLESVIV